MELAARKNTAGAFDMLERIGAVTELPEGKVQAAATVAYVEATGASKVALLVAPTWNEIEVVTEKVREALKDSGRLRGPDHEMKTFDSLSWTVAEKRDPARYRTGQWVRFHLPRGPFRRHETLEVVGEAGGITVRREDGREQFYVSISRGRNRCRIFTDDREQLRARVTESSSRVAAVEAVNGHALRRELVRRAIRWVGQLPEQLRRWAQAPHPARTHRGSEDRSSQPTQPKPSLHV